MLWVKLKSSATNYYITSPGAPAYFQGGGPSPAGWDYKNMSGSVGISQVPAAVVEAIEAALKDKDGFIDLTEF